MAGEVDGAHDVAGTPGATASAEPAAPAAEPAAAPVAPGAATAVLIGAGDIVDCGHPQDAAATAALLDRLLAEADGTPAAVAALGDAAYDNGTPAEFARCYDPAWGRHKARTRPAPGNHEYGTRGAAGYFGYFGPAAGEPGKGYYSYDLGAWHVVVLNSNCRQVGGCGPGSPQEQWLRADLAAHPAACTAAYMHHPRFSSGQHGSERELQALWQALYDAGADVVLAGHDHTYERFAPLDAQGRLDPARGIRQFVAGTGGRSHYRFAAAQPNSEVRHSGTYGVLKLTLHPTSYAWQFVPVPGGTFTDSGSAPCH